MRVGVIEHDFLSIARAVVGVLPPRAVLSLLRDKQDSRDDLDQGLSPNALATFRQTLARGGAAALLRRGGWQRETFFAPKDRVRVGRLWERQPPPLRFTRFAFELCRWLTYEPVGGGQCPQAPRRGPDGIGDELLLYLACDLLAKLRIPLDPLRPMVARSALAQLAFPEALERYAKRPKLDQPERVTQLMNMAVLLEALQTDLAGHILRVERLKQTLVQCDRLTVVSTLASARYDALIVAAAEHGRVDVLRFLVEAASDLVHRDGRFELLDPSATLGARQKARIAAAGVLRAAERVVTMHGHMRHVGFVDDTYDQAQALLSRWERLEPAMAKVEPALKAWSAL